jgi:hypothetical protein
MSSVGLAMEDRARLAHLIRRMEVTHRPLERQLAEVEASRILEEYGLDWGDLRLAMGNW